MNLLLPFLLAFSPPALSSADFGRPTERVIRIEVPNHDAVYVLQHQLDLTVVDAQDRYVIAYADDDHIRRLRELEYRVTVLLNDYRRQTSAELATYATYAEVCSTMNYLAGQHPAIARLETLGLSVQGRVIPIMKVTANPTQEAARPRIRLVGPHHGNEKIATEITLAFLKYLCESYDTSPGIRDVVDNREIWICPIFNVDGHVANSRYNANGIDLNRDWGYEWYGDGGSPSPISQVETQAMRQNSERHVFNLEYAYHSAAAYVNYLWDNHPSDPPDSGYIIALSQRYADSTYGSGTQLDPINGYDWYEVHGSCQDYTFGVYGGIATTIETAQPGNRQAVDNICVANRRALLDMIRLAGWGIQGLVYDSATAAPLFARIEFAAPYRWTTYAQPQVGDFHKMVPAGTYTVKVSANGYVSKTITGVAVPDTGSTLLDVPLVPAAPETPNYVQKVVTVERIDDSHVYRDWTIRSLGEPDGVYYSVGPSPSNVVFDVDPYQPVRNLQGNDITVLASGAYSFAAANNWTGPWFSLGAGNGTTSFDLASVSLDSARYLKLTSTGTPVLDAISYVGGRMSQIADEPQPAHLLQLSVTPIPASRQVRIALSDPLPGPAARLKITDVAGRVVRVWNVADGTRLVSWDLRDDLGCDIRTGIYFCLLETPGVSQTRKLIVRR